MQIVIAFKNELSVVVKHGGHCVRSGKFRLCKNTVVATVSVGDQPTCVALTRDGTRAYVTNFQGPSVSVIDTATNSVVATVPVDPNPVGVAITPDGTYAYVATGRLAALLQARRHQPPLPPRPRPRSWPRFRARARSCCWCGRTTRTTRRASTSSAVSCPRRRSPNSRAWSPT